MSPHVSVTVCARYTGMITHGFSGPEGIERLCKDIGVEPENITMLVIAWKMNARRMGFFTLQEWLKGFSELQ